MIGGDDEARTARHEAAHAVVAHLLGGDVRMVTLETEEESHAGHTEVAWSLRGQELSEASAWVALAGPLAELSLDRDSVEDPETVSAWQQDWDEVQGAAARIESDPSRRDKLVKQWVVEVHDLLADPAVDEQVARVADALEAHGTLDDTLFGDCLA